MMPTDLALDIPVVDHHCHGVSPAELSYPEFQALFSESDRPPPAGTNEFQKPLGLAIRSLCAPVLDLEPHVDGARYVERRLALGAHEVNRRFLQRSNCERMLVDTGHRSASILDFAEMGHLAGVKTCEVVRIEAVIEEIARGGIAAAELFNAVPRILEQRSQAAVGLKTVVAYRATFDIDQTPPTRAEVEAAADRWLASSERDHKFRLTDPVIIRHGLWCGGEVGRTRDFPCKSMLVLATRT